MDKDTLLFRQVHPSWVVGDMISQQTFSSQVFKPTPKDGGLLSVYNGDVFDAYTAYEHYAAQGLSSAGTVAVTPAECGQAHVTVLEDNDPFEGHCSMDYRALSSNATKKAAATLKQFAQDRGWCYKKDDA